MKRRPRSENRRVLRKLETTIGSRVFPFRSPPTSMPSVGARRSTRVFVPKASASKARPSRSSLPQSRSEGDDNDWLPLAWWKPEEGKRRFSGVGVAGWNKSAVMPAEPTPSPAAAAAPEPGNPRLVYRRSRKRKLVLKELKMLDRPRSTEINYVYSRKRRRSQMEASTSSSASKGNFKGLCYVRRPLKKLKLDPLVGPLAVVAPVETVLDVRELEDETMQLAVTESEMVPDSEHEDEAMQLALMESGKVEDREYGDAGMQLALMESRRVEDTEHEDAVMQLALTESGRVEDRENEDAVMQLSLKESGRAEDSENEDATMQLATTELGRDFGEKVVGILERDICTSSDDLMLVEPSGHGGVDCSEIVVEERDHVEAATQLVISELACFLEGNLSNVPKSACVSEGNLSSVTNEPIAHATLVEPPGNGELACKETVVGDRGQEDAAMHPVITESAIFSEGNLSSVPNDPIAHATLVEPSGNGELACKETIVGDRGQEDAAMHPVITESAFFLEGKLSSGPNEPIAHATLVEPSGNGELACKETVVGDRGQEDAATHPVITESACFSEGNLSSVPNEPIVHAILVEPSGNEEMGCKETVVDDRGQEDGATQLVIAESVCFSEGNLSSVLNEPLAHAMLLEPSGNGEMACKETVVGDRGQEDAATQLVITESACFSEDKLSSVLNEPLAHAMLVEPSGNGEMACKETVVDDMMQEDGSTQLVIVESVCFAEGNLSSVLNETLAHAMLLEPSGNGEMACKETVVGDRGQEDAATQLVITESACFSEGKLSSVLNEPLVHAMPVEPSGNGEMACKETVVDDMMQDDAATQLVVMESTENYAEMVVDDSEGDLRTVVDEPLELDTHVKPSGNDEAAAGRETVAEDWGHEDATVQLVIPESVRNFAELVGVSEGDLCTSPDESLALAVLVEPSCHGGVDRFARILSSVVRWMRRPRAALWSLTMFLFSGSLVGVFTLHGIHFLPLKLSKIDISPRNAVSGCGLCKIYNAGQSVPSVSIDFSTLPLFFKDLHIALALGSFFLSGVLIKYLMDTSRFEEERYAIVPVENREVTYFSDPAAVSNEVTSFSDPVVVSNEVTSFSYPVVASNEITSFSDPVVASNEVVPFGPVESSNELVTLADTPELVVQNMAIGHSSNLQKHPKKKRKMRSRADRKVAVSLQASCPSLHNFMEPIRVKPVDAWVGDMAREDDDTTSPCGPLKSRKFEGTREMKSALAEIKQNIDLARCNVNILVTATDRCWRVEGAEIMLEFSESREWCIAVKVQDIIRYLHKPQEWRPCAVNRLNHTYMWGWEDGWKLEFFDKWDWYVFKELHAECRERNALGVPVKIIPVPGVKEVSDYDDIISSSFIRPDMYIRMASNEIERAVASEHASYDMDSEDEEWLKQQSEDNSRVHIPADVFEKIIFALETNAYNNPHDIPDKERAIDLCQDLGGRDIVACLYDYWLIKRNKSCSSLVKVFQVPPLTGTQFLQKPHLRKKRSLTRQRSQARRGKPDFYLQAGAEQEARRRAHELEIAANQATEAAIYQRNRAQVLMENAELAAYKSAMALRIAEAKRVSESSHIASVILD